MEHDIFLPGLPVKLIRAAYLAAPGNEIESGKFTSPESSASLVANTFGLFLGQPKVLPPLPRTQDLAWPAECLKLESIVRFPWSGGRHPCLDVLVVTGNALIGIESKRYEPFRSKKRVSLSRAYWRRVWGNQMAGYKRIRDDLRDGHSKFLHLDAAQLMKHAFGLRTAVHREARLTGKRPVLYYLYAEPETWPGDKGLVPVADRVRHRAEILAFGEAVAGDEVEFRSCSYSELLRSWSAHPGEPLRAHASAIGARFSP